jgi:hypothetical protein
MDIQIDSEIHLLSFFRCIGYKSTFYQFKQTWTSMIENSSKGDNYKLFKHDLKFEDYLDVLDDKDKFLLVKLFNQAHVTFLF